MHAALRALVLGILLTALLAGIVDLVAVALGGGVPVSLAVTGGLLLCLGWGAVHEGVGPAPPRASFAWLGLAAALPSLAGWAPWSGLAALLLVLPLRATGARLAGIVGERAAAVTGLACGAAIGMLWVQRFGLGLPVFLGVWVVAGLAQRYLLPPPVEEPPADDPVPPGTALFGAGTAWLVLGVLPWLDVLDTSNAVHDLLRTGTAALFFLLGWATLGGAAAEWKRHRLVALVAAAALGALATDLIRDVAWYSSTPGYTASIGSQALREWTQSDAPYLSAENPAYQLVLAVAMLALPLALAGAMLRALGGNHPHGRTFLSPLLAGGGAALALAGLFPGVFAAAGMLPAAVALFLGAAMEGWWTPLGRPWRIVLAGVPLVLGALLVRVQPPPETGFPFPDAYRWSVAVDGDGARLERRTLASVVRRLERQAPVEEGAWTFTADGRNLLTPDPRHRDAWLAETRFVAGLVGDRKRALVVGSPWQPALEALRREGFEELTVACDPPQLARVELAGTPDEGAVRVVRTAVQAAGDQDLILLRDPLLWQGNHHLLRQDLLKQCKRRLHAGGVLAFACAPEQFEARMFPQWVDEFRRLFEVVELWVLPDGLDGARLVVTGRATPSGVPDGEMLSVELTTLRAGRPFLYRAPFPPSLPLLATTDRKDVEAHRAVRRAARVLTELQVREEGERMSLLGFYALQLGAQQYSVHDSFLTANPYAVEIGDEALDELLRVSRAQPDSRVLREVWAEVGRGLVEQQMVAQADRCFRILYDELGWREPEVLLTLAHVALEMLEEELALQRLDEALRLRPGWRPAEELHRILVAGEAPQRDLHAGHDHD